jgi:ADP-heptose:LPS heptosyltransferase/O-antigen/teichoic acid export membrane protein
MSGSSLTSIWRARLGTDDKADRGRQRLERANLTAIVSIGFRGAMLLSSFLYVPATIHYLGPERYGLWLAMTSIITLIAFADCGLGFSLMNDVAYSVGRGADDSVQRSVSSTFFVLAAIGGLGCLLFAAAYPFIPWQAAFRTATVAEATEVSRTVAVIVCGFLLTLPFTIVQRVQSAHQEGFKTQAWEIGGVVFSLAGLLIAIHLRAGLPVLAVVFTTGPLLAMVFNWLSYFTISHPAERPVLRLFDSHLARKIAREGGYFLILQLAGIAVFSVDSFIILHYFGQAAFAKYSLVAKLFQVTPALAGVWFAALWPAYAEAIARGDNDWVRRTLRRSTILSAAGCVVVSCGAAILVRPVIHWWTGTEVDPSMKLLAGWVVYWAMVTGTSGIGAYFNASKFIKGQTVLAVANAVCSVSLKIMLCKYWDISGAVWGANLAYAVVVIPTCCVIVPRLLRQQNSSTRPRVWSNPFFSAFVYLLRYALPTMVLAVISPRRRREPQPGPPRILVTSLDGIGDFVMISPFLRELRRNYHESTIVLLVRENARQLAMACPYVDKVLKMEPEPNRKAFSNYLKYLLAMVRHLRELKAFADRDLLGRTDLAIHVQSGLAMQWGNLITYLSGAARRVGYSTNTSPTAVLCNLGHSYLFTDVLPTGGHRHEVQRSLDILRHLGGSIESEAPEIWWTFEERLQADRFLDEHNLSGRPIIAFGIGAFENKRCWPFYGELIGLLAKKMEFTPLLLCGPHEQAVAREIVAAYPLAVAMERMPLTVVAATLSRCELFVGNDSGPMHLAAATGCPVVEISCHAIGSSLGHPNDPERFGPLGVPRLIVRPKRLAEGCEDGCRQILPHCIAGVRPEDVAAEMAQFVESTGLNLMGYEARCVGGR